MIDSIDRQTKTIFTCILLLWGRGMCIAWCTHGGWRTICTSQISYHLSFRTQAQVHWAQQKVPLPAEPSWQSNICFIVYSKIKLRLFRNMHRKERGEKKGTDRHREEKKKKPDRDRLSLGFSPDMKLTVQIKSVWPTISCEPPASVLKELGLQTCSTPWSLQLFHLYGSAELLLITKFIMVP